MAIFALLHYQEIVGVYSTRALAERAKGIGHVSTLDPRGWFIEMWELDYLPHQK